jgi:hypothetical protein
MHKSLCQKKDNPRIPSVFWIWRNADFQERGSYDMVGISYDNHPCLKRILMPKIWIGWPLRKDYITPNFYEIQHAHWMIRNSCSLIQCNTTPDFIQVKEYFYVLFLDETEYLFIILEFIPIIQKCLDRLRKRASFWFSNLENHIFISFV